MYEDVTSVQRTEKFKELIDNLRETYADARLFKVEMKFEWQVPPDDDLDSELCPVVSIHIER